MIYQPNKCKYRVTGRPRRLLTRGFILQPGEGRWEIDLSAAVPRLLGPVWKRAQSEMERPLPLCKRFSSFLFFSTTHWLWKSDFSTFVPLVILNLYFAYCKFDDLRAAFGTAAVFTICRTQGVAVARARPCQALWQYEIKDIHLISARWSKNLFPAPQYLNQLAQNGDARFDCECRTDITAPNRHSQYWVTTKVSDDVAWR